MHKTLPIFPLNMVAFPGEMVNLHIFEPRYKQLINECREHGHTFGLPAYINQRVKEFGTEMRVVEISKQYGDGKMDIRVEGIECFKITEFISQLPEKLYAGAVVYTIPDVNNADTSMQNEIVGYLEEIFSALGVAKQFKQFSTFEIGHYIGFTQTEEYNLLKTNNEYDRQKMVIAHLKKILPNVLHTKKIKERIQLNGHFQSFDPLSF